MGTGSAFSKEPGVDWKTPLEGLPGVHVPEAVVPKGHPTGTFVSQIQGEFL